MPKIEPVSIYAAEGERAGEAFSEFSAAFVSAFLGKTPLYISGESATRAAEQAFAVYYRHMLDIAIDMHGL